MLHFAAKKALVKTCELLVAKMSLNIINAVNETGMTALHEAAGKGACEIFKLLSLNTTSKVMETITIMKDEKTDVVIISKSLHLVFFKLLQGLENAKTVEAKKAMQESMIQITQILLSRTPIEEASWFIKIGSPENNILVAETALHYILFSLLHETDKARTIEVKKVAQHCLLKMSKILIPKILPEQLAMITKISTPDSSGRIEGTILDYIES